MWLPFFFGVILTYGVLPYAMIPTYGVLPFAMIMKIPPFDSLVWGSLRLAPIYVLYIVYPLVHVYADCIR